MTLSFFCCLINKQLYTSFWKIATKEKWFWFSQISKEIGDRTPGRHHRFDIVVLCGTSVREGSRWRRSRSQKYDLRTSPSFCDPSLSISLFLYPLLLWHKISDDSLSVSVLSVITDVNLIPETILILWVSHTRHTWSSSVPAVSYDLYTLNVSLRPSTLFPPPTSFLRLLYRLGRPGLIRWGFILPNDSTVVNSSSSMSFRKTEGKRIFVLFLNVRVFHRTRGEEMVPLVSNW